MATAIEYGLIAAGITVAGLAVWNGLHDAKPSDTQASPAIAQPGCNKTSSIKDTGVGPVRVDVAAYFAERAANTARLG
jgi:cytochrome c551/c552